MAPPNNTVGRRVVVKEEYPELAMAPPPNPVVTAQDRPRVIKRQRIARAGRARGSSTFRKLPDYRFGESVEMKTEEYLAYTRKLKQVCNDRTPPLNADLQCVKDNVDRTGILFSAWKSKSVELKKEVTELHGQTIDLGRALREVNEDSKKKDKEIARLEERIRKLEIKQEKP